MGNAAGTKKPRGVELEDPPPLEYTAVLPEDTSGGGELATPGPTPDLTILHFNDVYHITSQSNGSGGAAKFATLVRKFKRNYNALVLFSGDVFNPSTLSTVTKGKHMVPVLNALGVEAACYGNHDFDFGVDELVKLAGACSMAWVMTNVVDSRSGQPVAGAVSSHVVVHAGVRIGIIGIAEEEWLEAVNNLPDYVKYVDKVEAAKAECGKLRSAGCEIIIALTHMREHNDVAFTRDVPQVDLVLGGHDHHWKELEVNSVKVLNSGTDFKQMSLLKIWLPVSTLVKPRVHITAVDVTADIQEDPQVKVIVEDYVRQLADKIDKELCVAARELDVQTEVVRTCEVPIGNLLTDVMRMELEADLAIVNSGVLRADITYLPGVLTIKDILDIIPIEDVVVLMEIRGKHVRSALENGVSKYPALEGRFPQVSGIRFNFDPERPAGARVSDVFVGSRHLNDERSYKVATTMFLAKGGDGYVAFREKRRFLIEEENGPILPSMIRTYIEGLVPEHSRRERAQSIQSVKSDQRLDRMERRVSVASLKKAYLPTIAPLTEGRITMGTKGLGREYSVSSIGTSSSDGTLRPPTPGALSAPSPPLSRRTSVRSPIPKEFTMQNLLDTQEGSEHVSFRRRSHHGSLDGSVSSLRELGSMGDLGSQDGEMPYHRRPSHSLPPTNKASSPHLLRASPSAQSDKQPTVTVTRPDDVEPPNVWEFAYRGDLRGLQSLLKMKGATDLNVQGKRSCPDVSEHVQVGLGPPDMIATPLHYAIANCQMDTVQYLLKRGADRNIRSDMGCNARELAFANYAIALSKNQSDKAKAYRAIVDTLDEHEALAYIDETMDWTPDHTKQVKW